jgi:uncharacterized protein YbbK (DUF523 family)/uncharacterized protein YbgA (DUF1722 family)
MPVIHPYQPPPVGVSSCLLGDNVRYDGSNMGDDYITETLAHHLKFIPVCPEVAIGMGVPRSPIQLVSNKGEVFAVGVNKPELDVTADLVNFGKQKGYSSNALCGYIFKSRSPSCGLTDTPAIAEGGTSEGPGIFSRQILKACPYLPVIDEISLKNPGLRDNFLERLFVMARWHQLLIGPPSLVHLQAFHEAHELQLSMHQSGIHNKLSRFLNVLSEPLPGDAELAYLDSFMSALEMSDSENYRSRLLAAVLARLDGLISDNERRELDVNNVDGEAALADLLRHIKSLAHKYGIESLAHQSCINPSPAEAALRYL